MVDPKCKVIFTTTEYIFIKCGKQKFAIIPKTKLKHKLGDKKGFAKKFKKYVTEINALRGTSLSDVKNKYGKKNMIPEKV